jgi:8-oxo-dGTP diphosphatase
MKLLLVVAAALVDPDGRVLIAQRPEGKQLAGLWEFPGGKVDPGERPEAALIRELGEELGIEVEEACLAPLTFASHTYEDFHLLMPLYVCRRWREMGEAAKPARLSNAASRCAAHSVTDRPLGISLADQRPKGSNTHSWFAK